MASTVIPVYLAQMLEKLKRLAPQTTDNIVSKEEGEAAGKGLTPAQSTPKIDYPAAPQRTVLPDTTQFEATPNRSSVALATAGLVAQKNANLEAANEEIAQKAWFEKMKDTSDIYKTDRAIDRQTAAEEARMKRLEAEAQARADLETQRQTGRKELIGVKGEQQSALAAQRAQAQLDLANKKANMRREYMSFSKEKQQKLDEYVTQKLDEQGLEQRDVTPDEMVKLFEDAKKTLYGETPKVGSGLPEYNERPGIKATAQKIRSAENVNDLLEQPEFNDVVSQYKYDTLERAYVDANGEPVAPIKIANEIKSKLKGKGYSNTDYINAINKALGK